MKTKEEKNQENKLYYEVNKERILAMKQTQRDEIKGVVRAKALTPEETVEKRKKKRREWYKLNSDKVIARNKAYREANKAKLKIKWDADNKANSAKNKEANAIGLKTIADKYAPQRTKAMEDLYITRTQIAKDLGVRLSYIDGISRKERYRMPKHKETNGVVYLYDRKEITAWYEYARDVLAFHRLGEKIPRKRDFYSFNKGSMVHGLITFMQKNKKLHLRNIEQRRIERKLYV